MPGPEAREAQVELLHDGFSRWASQAPQAVAVVTDERTVTYAELEEAAGRLASALVARGVGAEQHVAICLPRSIELVIATLAVLGAGGAAVTVDPEWPDERIRVVLADVGASLCVTSSPERLPPHVAALAPSATGTTPVASRPSPDNLALVIYTSGSTGTPKGIAIAHRSIVQCIEREIAEFGILRSDCVLQVASITFDASLSEIFTALNTGARLCLAPGDLVTPAELASYMRRHQVTVIQGCPSFLGTLDPSEIPGVRVVVMGGEPVSRRLVAEWTAPQRRVVSVYGTTETTDSSSIATVHPAQLVTLGSAFVGERLYTLDDRLQQVSPGGKGEIYIGGEGVTRGYFGRARLTASRFLPDPWGPPGARMYRTGDLAHVMPDGRLEFAGRVDRQVKIRGFRVELGEIEFAICDLPGVADALVVTTGSDEDDKGLAACVVPDGAVDVSGLRQSLVARLPHWMVPGRWTLLDKLPLTERGKIDLAAVHRLIAATQNATAGEGPVGPDEALLGEIWKVVLGVDRVGRDDDFYCLGGDSLRAAQIAGRLAERGRSLTIRAILEHRTIAAIALEMEVIRLGDTTIRPRRATRTH